MVGESINEVITRVHEIESVYLRAGIINPPSTIATRGGLPYSLEAELLTLINGAMMMISRAATIYAKPIWGGGKYLDRKRQWKMVDQLVTHTMAIGNVKIHEIGTGNMEKEYREIHYPPRSHTALYGSGGIYHRISPATSGLITKLGSDQLEHVEAKYEEIRLAGLENNESIVMLNLNRPRTDNTRVKSTVKRVTKTGRGNSRSSNRA